MTIIIIQYTFINSCSSCKSFSVNHELSAPCTVVLTHTYTQALSIDCKHITTSAINRNIKIVSSQHSEWMFHITYTRSFHRWVFTGNWPHWYWQWNTISKIKYTNNAKKLTQRQTNHLVQTKHTKHTHVNLRSILKYCNNCSHESAYNCVHTKHNHLSLL